MKKALQKTIVGLLALYQVALLSIALLFGFKALLTAMGDEFINNNVALSAVLLMATFVLVAFCYMASMFARMNTLEGLFRGNNKAINSPLWYLNPLPSAKGLQLFYLDMTGKNPSYIVTK
jgi:uncharacterized membrane protein